MNIRERTEIYEDEHLSPFAQRSSESMGRDVVEEECDVRTVFQRDRDRIIHCKSFRRLNRKTQVFLAPEGDHYRTRLTHTLEVSQIARTIARALKMNEDLTEAIALGHDLGHTPFGHCGERTLNEISSEGFAHNEQSIRVVEKIERDGQGLNLTKEVRDGILNHSMSKSPSTMEGKIVRYADKIAYINHDMDDAIRAGILTEDSIPREISSVLGRTVRERLDVLIHSVIASSMNESSIQMDDEIEGAMVELRKFMFKNLYHDKIAKAEESKAEEVVKQLFNYYIEHPTEMPESFINLTLTGGQNWERTVLDYISCMTDSYAIHVFDELFLPKAWQY